MRQLSKKQVYASSADRPVGTGTTGNFLLNIGQSALELDKGEDVYYKIYLQQFVIRWDDPYIFATTGQYTGNSLVQIARNYGAGPIYTFYDFTIPTGGPSATEIASIITSAVAGTAANQIPNFSLTYDAPTGKFRFGADPAVSITPYQVLFPTGRPTAHKVLGFVQGTTYLVNDATGILGPNIACPCSVQTIDVSCTFGGDNRFSTQNRVAAEPTNTCASAPILSPWLSNVAYVDVTGANGLIATSARTDFQKLQVVVSNSDDRQWDPVNDWQFVVSIEAWKETDDKLLRTTEDMLHVLQIGTIGATFNERRYLLKDADLDIPLPDEFTKPPESNADDPALLQNDPSKYPPPPPDLGGLVPFDFVDRLSLNDPANERAALKRARGM